MNYGYDSEREGWDPEKKQELAERLSDELGLPVATAVSAPRGKPYIEIDGLYEGVRIRRITNLSEGDREGLVKIADAVYDEVMGIERDG